MANLALRYSRLIGTNPVVVAVPRGGVTRLHLPGDDVKSSTYGRARGCAGASARYRAKSA